MERSSSALSALNSGDGFTVVSGGAAESLGVMENKRALSAPQRMKRRRGGAEMESFKSASLTIRRVNQSFSVRHRRGRDKARVRRPQAAKIPDLGLDDADTSGVVMQSPRNNIASLAARLWIVRRALAAGRSGWRA